MLPPPPREPTLVIPCSRLPLFAGRTHFKESPIHNKTPSPGSHCDRLGVWSVADVMWELSPGLRAVAGQQRPAAAEEVVELFYELGPVKCKVSEMYMRRTRCGHT